MTEPRSPRSDYKVVAKSVDNATTLYWLHLRNEPLSAADVLTLWRTDDAFTEWFVAILQDCEYDTYRWETPPTTRQSLEQPFEFALIDSPGLAPVADPNPFNQHFAAADESQEVLEFDNLSGDARLVVPTPRGPHEHYRHLAAFSRLASPQQQQRLWQVVGKVAQEKLCDKPIWLSTAGGGVSWLHVRFDASPKYYRHKPYKAGHGWIGKLLRR
ncbi:MAG: hypothetical protein AAF266_06900 [Planctomycetota bacterium]